MKNYPIVEVEWVDSLRLGGWRGEREYLEATTGICWTAGYLVKSSPKHITIVLSRDPLNENMNDSIIIPRRAIKGMRKLN